MPQRNYIRKRNVTKEVPNDTRLRRGSISPLGDTDGFDDSDFYGFCGVFEQNTGRAKLEIQADMMYQETELEIYNENTEEWEEAQIRYGKLKGI